MLRSVFVFLFYSFYALIYLCGFSVLGLMDFSLRNFFGLWILVNIFVFTIASGVKKGIIFYEVYKRAKSREEVGGKFEG